MHYETHYVASNIPIFLSVEFVGSVDKYQPLQWRGNGFWTGRVPEPENLK